MERFLSDMSGLLLQQGWQIAAVFAVVAAACQLLRKASAHCRYLLWLIVLAKCLVPPLVTVPLAVLPAKQAPEVQEQVAMASPAPTPAPSEGAASPSPVDPPAGVPDEATAPPGGAPPAAGGTSRTGLTVRQAVAAGWIVGAGAFLLFFLLKACRIHRRLRRTRRLANRYLQSEAADVSGRLGLARAPGLYFADGLSRPFVWGLLRGSIFLPTDFGEVTTAEQRRAILGHELAHVARWDALVNTVQTIAQGIFFFHPLVWWANREIRREREKCCDEMAVAALGSPPGRYSSAIVEALATKCQETEALSSLAVAGPVRAIEERIQTIMRPNRTFHKRPTWAALGAAVMLAVVTVPTDLVLTAGAVPAADTSAERPEQPASGRRDVEMVPCVRKYSVMLVIGRDRITFEGRDVTWEKLPALLEQVSNRGRTVLAVAVPDGGDDTQQRRKELMSRAARLSKGLHFDYLSYVGAQRLGAKGEARFDPITTPAEIDAKRAKAKAAAGRFLGVWSGVGVDKPDDGISLDLLTLELKVSDDGLLKAAATGRFVLGGERDLEDLRIDGDRLEFIVRHRTDVRIKASLRLEGGTLRGDGVPIGTTEDRCDILLSRQPAPKRGLGGLWYGLAIDKPGQGTSVDAIVVDLTEARGGKTTGAAYGRFSQSSAQKLKKLRAEDGIVEFEMIHRTGMRMKVSLKLKDGKLVGEGIPIDSDEDACDITLQRARPGAKEPPFHRMTAWRLSPFSGETRR
jgi:beta-lactamase regulating signal transducer with metallopeptidase domain